MAHFVNLLINMSPASVFDFVDYRDFLRAYAERSGTEGREKKTGELRRIADAARVFPSYLSQILSQKRDFTLDQGIQVADHCGLGETERKYFLLSIQLSRAATLRLRSEIEREMQKLKSDYLELSARLPNQKELTLEDSAQFYSSWIPIALRLYTAIPRLQTLPELSAKLGLTEKKLKPIMDFLVRTGLCVRSKEGRYEYGPKHIHLNAEHPLITKHHSNWRVRAMEKHAFLESSRELAYSGILALSKSDALKIRALLPQWIDQARAISDPSQSEAVYCLNFDWFEV